MDQPVFRIRQIKGKYYVMFGIGKLRFFGGYKMIWKHYYFYSGLDKPFGFETKERATQNLVNDIKNQIAIIL